MAWHRGQLDGVRSLTEAAKRLRLLAAELRGAHDAGWGLVEPVRGGRLIAERATRPRRDRAAALASGAAGTPPPVRWRVRLVDESPVSGDEVLSLEHAPRTPVFAPVDAGLQQVAGPAVARATADELVRQVAPAELGGRPWGLAPARVGPAVDLVAEGSVLLVHAVSGGALVRTAETLVSAYAADRASSLPEAAAAYERLARVADLMAAAGGHVVTVDDGFLEVAYPAP